MIELDPEDDFEGFEFSPLPCKILVKLPNLLSQLANLNQLTHQVVAQSSGALMGVAEAGRMSVAVRVSECFPDFHSYCQLLWLLFNFPMTNTCTTLIYTNSPSLDYQESGMEFSGVLWGWCKFARFWELGWGSP